MIKEVIAFNYSERWPFRESEEWYFERHSEMVRQLPHLSKYCTYRSIRLPKNDFIPSDPRFVRIEELWWPSRELYEVASMSAEMQAMQKDLEDPELGPRLSGVKRAFLEREINVMHPELSGLPGTTMNELDGKPHIKSLWCFSYLKELPPDEADGWYLNHHILLAARKFNLTRYVTYSPANGLGAVHGFARFTELCWRDWQAMLNDYESPRGKEVFEDNKNGKGLSRLINKTTFMDYPHVVGHETVFM